LLDHPFAPLAYVESVARMPPIHREALDASASGRRKLMAVVHADIAGYARLIGQDDAGTVVRLRLLRSKLIDPAVAQNGGSIVQTAGDSLLIIFDSIYGAVRCAIEIQIGIPAFDETEIEDRCIRFRIGVNIGDVIVDGSDYHSEGVNIAARLQTACPPGDIYVSRTVRDQIMAHADLSFEPVGVLELKNIAQPVETFVLRFHPTPKATERTSVPAQAATAPQSDRPSIAVLPFANLNGDPGQEYFSDGVADDIITELSRDHTLFVIARHSSFKYRGHLIDLKQVGRELGVRYVVTGSVRRDEDAIRVSAQLIDAITSTNVWAERYDRQLRQVFAVQEEIAASVVTAIRPAVGTAEQHRVFRKVSENLNAWELYQRGMWYMSRPSRVENERARQCFQQATELDKSFASPFVGVALTYLLDVLAYGVFHPSDVAQRMEQEARSAIALDPNDSEGHAMLGFAFTFAGNHRANRECAQRALMLNRNSALGHLTSGVNWIVSGRCSEGRAECLMALRLDPHSPVAAATLGSIATSYFFEADYPAAIEAAQRCLADYPSYAPPRRILVAALGQTDRLSEAAAELQKFQEASPDVFTAWVANRLPWFRPEDQEHIREGLRKAGWNG
jgi:adenylate cyclase